jgi:outer membrane assembly lipoprotein YfgL
LPTALSLAVFAAAAAVLVAGCGTDKPKPAPLEPVSPQIAVRAVWSHKLDSVRFPLSISVRDSSFLVADSSGTVVALDAQTGTAKWRGNAGAPIAAGVGSDGRYAAVVTRNNELVVLEGGSERWRTQLTSRTTTAPLVAGERVFVVGVDRAVHAFDALDGHRLWSLQRPGEALTLLQSGVLTAYRDTLVVGQGVALAGVDPLAGTVRWEVPLATPRGTNEVERLADLIGPALRIDSVLCARAFQAAVGCVDADSGKLAWSRNAGGVQAIGGNGQYLFGADASDRISAWRTAGGEIVWNSDKLLYRGLSAPLATERAVVFGDAEGLLHFLARDSGVPLLRLATDGSGVVGAPAIWGTTVAVATRAGGVFAYRFE